jgi:hypothetical protein
LAYSTRPRRYADASANSARLNKDVWGCLPQTILSQSISSTSPLNGAVCGSHPQTPPSQVSTSENCAVPTAEFTFAQPSSMDSQVLIDCSQQWQTVKPSGKRRRTDSRSAESTQASQNSNKSIKILTRPKASQNRKGPGRPRLSSQITVDDLNIAEFFTQSTDL